MHPQFAPLSDGRPLPRDFVAEVNNTVNLVVNSANLVQPIKLDQPFRVQAVVIQEGVSVDRLDDEERGGQFILELPSFPHCFPQEDGVPGRTARVTFEGLLPEREVHALLGPDLVLAGVNSDAQGNGTIDLPIPAGTPEGPHLVTIGHDGLALTADCTINVTHTIQPQRGLMYSVPFECVPTVGPVAGALEPSRYSTVINVHNPNASDIAFMKKAVVARSEDEERGVVSMFVQDKLAPNQALSIDCGDIVGMLGGPQPVGNGFVVLLSEAYLDVFAVYTAGRQGSIDVEHIQPTPVQMPPEP